MNAPAIKITRPVREQVRKEEWEVCVVLRNHGLLEWPAMLRKLDRKDPSYAD